MLKRTHFLITTLFCVVFLTNIHAQSEKAQVEQAVWDYLNAFYTGDETLIKRSVSPTVYKVGYYIPRGKSPYQSEPMSYQEMIDYAISVKKNNRFPKADAPKAVEIFEVSEQIASAKLTAWWGFDYILLAKKDGKWMIDQVLYVNPPPKK